MFPGGGRGTSGDKRKMENSGGEQSKRGKSEGGGSNGLADTIAQHMNGNPAPDPAPEPCRHTPIFLYLRSCMICDRRCNCDLAVDYPDVLVRSLDKQIVPLSKELVSASQSLRSMVNKALGRNNKTKEYENEVKLEEEKFVCKSDRDDTSISLEKLKRIEDWEMSEDEEEESLKNLSPAQQLKQKVLKATEDRVVDLVEVTEKKFLVLFDEKTNTPTFGITKATFQKLNDYIAKHSEHVDQRDAEQRRKNEFLKPYETPPKYYNGIADDERLINTFAYEDWEEEFFEGLSPLEFCDISQANQDLYIWDLYWGLEKWTLLFRGRPREMANGVYNPPLEQDAFDKRTIFGIYNMGYDNPRARSRRRPNRVANRSSSNREEFRAKWWTIKRC